MNKQRIVLSPSAYLPNRGGIEEITRALSLELVARGWDVVIATNRFPASTAAVESLDSILVRRFRFEFPSRTIQTIRQVVVGMFELLAYIKFLREFRPSIVHIMGVGPNAFYTRLARSIVPFKMVVSTHGELMQDATDIYGRSVFARWAAQQSMNHADAVSGCSLYVLNEARRRFRIPETATVIHNGISALESHGKPLPCLLPSHPSYILGLGRLAKNKGFEFLVRAFAKLPRDSDLHLIIAGDGVDRARLEAIAVELSIQDRTQFVGAVTREQARYLFANCFCFVSPCPIEGFGLACLEAMLAGKAVIASNSGGPTEFIRHRENGLLFEPYSPESLAQELERLISDSALRSSLEAASIETAREFDLGTMVDRYERFYLLAVEGNA